VNYVRRETGGIQQKILRNWKQYSSRKFSGFLQVDFENFPCFSPGSIGKNPAGILLPCLRYFSCFAAGSGDFPASFLPDPVAGTINLGL
jgi:hypothetical protein